MNRRNFISSLGTLAAASIFLPRAADAFRWKQSTGGMWVINPAWLTAPYRVDFMFQPGVFKRFVMPRQTGERTFHPKDAGIWVTDQFPVHLDGFGRVVPVKIRKITP